MGWFGNWFGSLPSTIVFDTDTGIFEEVYVHRTLLAEIRGSDLSDLIVQVFGFRSAMPEQVLEWLALDVLSINRMTSRRGSWWGTVLFQVSCFARDGSQRGDGQSQAAILLASRIARLFEQRDIQIKTYGKTPLEVAAILSISAPNITVPIKDDDGVWNVPVTFRGTLVRP
jgi:hypothetical protein